MSTPLVLPQYNDEAKNQEIEQYLEEMRQLYAYTLTYNGNIATINKIPEQEKQTFYYKLRWFLNISQALLSLPKLLLTLLKGWLKVYPYRACKGYFFFNWSPFPDRKFLNNFEDDVYLGLQRIAGMNPVVISGLTEENPLPANFAAQSIVNELTPQSYEAALKEKRLYITDYSVLKMVADNLGETDEHQKKYVTAPIALYYRQDNGLLQPLAIQLHATQPTDATNPIYTPQHGQHWLMAKAYVQAADGTYHELWTHATRSHYVMESIIMATYRNFDRQHPLFPLLYPHLKYTISVNVQPLFEPAPDGKIPTFGKMFACTNPALVDFMGKGMREYDFQGMAFPNDIKNRRMEDEQLYYPYRDDGKLIWDAVHEFVGEYIHLYYQSDKDVMDDFELQAWGKNIGGSRLENNCGIPGFPTEFKTIDDVIKTVGNIIFITTGHHTSIHYPQYEYAGYVPNMPFSTYMPASTNFQEKISHKDFMCLFPHLKLAFFQALIFFWTDFRVNRMGDYDLEMFDGRPNELIKKYQNNLESISKIVEERNQKRQFPYKFMDPKNITNSITV